MNLSSYRKPPLVRVYLGHAIGTALLGVLLPSGENLEILHRFMLPIVKLIPNALRITTRASDPIFAQTFIGISLLIAFLVLIYFVIAVRGYHLKAFESEWERYWSLAFSWLIFGVLLTGAIWFVPYLDPASKGRAYFLMMAATSGTTGTLTVMNQLVVGLPLLFLLTLWSCHACTTVRSRERFT